MKTFNQFIEESRKQLKFLRYYHGTPESSEGKIRKSGFNTPEVYASTSKETARSFGERHGKDKTKVISFRVPSKDVKNAPPGRVVKTGGQRGRDDWGREYHSVAMDPSYAKKHISKEPEGRIYAPKIPKKYKSMAPEKFKLRTKTKLPEFNK
jgi:hypothetical protein